MKKLLLFFLIVFCTIQLRGQADQKIADLLNTNDYLEMGRIYPSLRNQLAYPMLGKMAEVGLACSLNQPEKGIVLIDSLLKKYGEELGFSNAANYVMLKGEQLNKLGRYQEAMISLEPLLSVCEDPALKLLLNGQYRKYKGLSQTPKSELIGARAHSTIIKMTPNSIDSTLYWYLPVDINGKQESFLFDTGAGHTIVSTSFAKKHSVKIVADSVLMTGITGEYTYTSVGVMDTLRIGDLIYSNMPVHIVDRIIPEHEKIGFAIDAVMGVPFMEAAGVIKIRPREMEMELLAGKSETGTADEAPNLTCFGGTMMTEAYYQDLRLPLLCDTGAAFDGWIDENVRNQNPDKFEGIISGSDSIRIGGLGGEIQTFYTEKLLEFPLKIGEKQVVCKGFSMVGDRVSGGILGFKFFQKQKEIILDFRKMILTVE